ncbi:MAG: hypothetical protein CMJ18_02250 [Phycisphaeraceae bacterium]|nr:hypothetical protein [Phycisphaeraceae bacterium]
MRQFLTALVMALALALVTQAQAQTVFTENFDNHTPGQLITDANGWTANNGAMTPPVIVASAPGLDGNAADGNQISGNNGAFTNFENDAGLTGGPHPIVIFEFDLRVNDSITTGSMGVSLQGTRTSISIRDGGANIGIADALDTDEIYPIPGGAIAQVLSFRIEADPQDTRFYMNDVLQQTSPSNGQSGSYNNINGIRWGCGIDPGVRCGIIDNIKVSIPEPASFGLLVMGGLMMLRRR